MSICSNPNHAKIKAQFIYFCFILVFNNVIHSKEGAGKTIWDVGEDMHACCIQERAVCVSRAVSASDAES